ncbi:MAG: hypothetical protein KF721_10190 [Ignavibacteriaceae bacterium]|nr:hypothetical protein [Ignavibacteriaceae bacterium]
MGILSTRIESIWTIYRIYTDSAKLITHLIKTETHLLIDSMENGVKNWQNTDFLKIGFVGLTLSCLIDIVVKGNL